jgi:hypothetical protein
MARGAREIHDGGRDGAVLADLLADDDAAAPDALTEVALLAEDVRSALSGLPARERRPRMPLRVAGRGDDER